MPLTADALKTQIIRDLGDAGGFLDSQVETVWTMYDDAATQALQGLYVKRHLAQSLLGELGRQALLASPDERDMIGERRRILSDQLAAVETLIATQNQTISGGGITMVPATFGGATATDEYSRGTGYW